MSNQEAPERSRVPTVEPHWHRARALGAAFPLLVGLILVSVVGIAAFGALGRTPATTPGTRTTIAILTVVVLLAWLGVTTAVSRTRTYQRSFWAAGFVILVPVVAGSILLAANAGASDVLAATPVAWPIEFQSVRLIGGVFLLAWLSGEISRPWFCWWAGSIDVVIGLTALPVAWWAAAGGTGSTALGVLWNLVGLLDFAVAMVVVVSDPSVMRDFFRSPGPAAGAVKPIILLIFSFAVPLAAIVHVLSLRQLL